MTHFLLNLMVLILTFNAVQPLLKGGEEQGVVLEATGHFLVARGQLVRDLVQHGRHFAQIYGQHLVILKNMILN